MKWWWSLVVSAVCLAHRLEGTFALSATDRDDRVQYLTKFACSIGECKYRVRAGLKHPNWSLQRAAAAGAPGQPRSVKHLTYADIDELQQWNNVNKTISDGRLVIRVVLDDEWETSHGMAGCKRAELGRGRTTLNVPLDGTLGPWSWNSFRQTYRPHFWYFFAEDCRNTVASQMSKLLNHSDAAGITPVRDNDLPATLPPAVFGDKLIQVQYEIEIFQVDGGNLSYDLKGLLFWIFLTGLAYGGLLVFMNRSSGHKVMDHHHGLLTLLNASAAANIVASSLYTAFILKIKRSATVTPLLIDGAELFFGISQLLIISCLILVAPGPSRATTGRDNGGTTFLGPIPFGEYGQYLFTHPYALAVVLIILNILCVQNDWLMMVYRLGLFALFLYLASPKSGGLAASGSPLGGNAPDLIRKMILASSIYFIPVIKLIVSKATNRYLQKMLLFHSTSIIYFLTILSLYRILGHKKFTNQTLLPARVWTLPSHHID